MAKTKGKLTTADYLPIEEFERLVEGLHNDNQHLWELYCRLSFCTALRASDVLSLTWDDIFERDSFDKQEKKTGKARRITLNKSVQNNKNKMNKFLKTADTFVGGVLLVGCMPSLFILIAIVGIFRSCMGYDEIDIDSADVRLVNIFVYGSEYEKLYRQPHKDYPDGIHFMDSHHDLGELYITENDIYPYNPDAGRTYRYWGCEAKTKTDERHTHITKWDRERASNRK